MPFWPHQFHVSPKFNPSAFGGILNAGELLDFVNLGGNVLLGLGDDNSEAVKDFAIEFSVDFTSKPVADYFSGEKDVEGSIQGRLAGSKYISDVKEPIFYSGNAHFLSGRNQLIKPLLVGKDSAFINDGTKITAKTRMGASIVLASTFQALNNARVLFASASLFKDESYDK